MINGVPSFRGFHMTEKGRESMKNKPISFIENDLLPTAREAKNDKINKLSVEDDGCIYIETPQYGKFTVNNPSSPEANGKYFSCEVRTMDGVVNRLSIPMENENVAKNFMNKNFACGEYIPKMNLDLYKAIVAADKYRQSMLDELEALSE